MSDANNRPRPDMLDRAADALRDAPAPPGPPPDLTAATLAAVQTRLAGAVPAKQIRRERRRRIMRYVGFGTAAAAAVAVATAGVFLLGGPSAAARFQKAMDEAAKAKSVRIVVKGGSDMVSTIHFRGDSLRSEGPGKRVIVCDLATREVLELDTEAKTARRYDLADDEAKAAAEEFAVALDTLNFFRGLKDATVKELKGEKVGDRPARVYEIRDPGDAKREAMTGTLWVDEKTGLPVRLRQQRPGGDWVFDFEGWNEKFDAKLFRLDVPEGYTEVEEKKPDSAGGGKKD